MLQWRIIIQKYLSICLNSMEIISVKNLCVGYEGKKVISKLSFDIDNGEYLCIVGENGAGKSTLLKSLVGLIKPILGNITFNKSIEKSDIGYIPQQNTIQKDFPASVWEVVLSGCVSHTGNRFFYDKNEKDCARKNINLLGLDEVIKKSYRDLSGGQQQRVLLARALCATREVLFLDEPASGLDHKVTGEMYNILDDLNKKGVTIIMISHDVGTVIKHAKKILHIGKKYFYGSVEEYTNSYIGKKFIETGCDCSE